MTDEPVVPTVEPGTEPEPQVSDEPAVEPVVSEPGVVDEPVTATDKTAETEPEKGQIDKAHQQTQQQLGNAMRRVQALDERDRLRQSTSHRRAASVVAAASTDPKQPVPKKGRRRARGCAAFPCAPATGSSRMHFPELSLLPRIHFDLISRSLPRHLDCISRSSPC